MVEGQFITFLRVMQPRQELMALVREAVIATSRQRSAEAQAEAKAINVRLAEPEAKEQQLEEMYVFGKKVDDESYARLRDKVRADITLARMEARDALDQAIDVEATLTFAEHVLVNAATVWEEATAEQKERIQRVFFPSGLTFDGETFGTVANACVFTYLQRLGEQKADLASPTGFEPVLSP